MFKKKRFTRCPDCRSKLDPKRQIGLVGVCIHCGWAGSFRSEQAADKIQFKVSAILLALGLLASYTVLNLEPIESSNPVMELESRLQANSKQEVLPPS